MTLVQIRNALVAQLVANWTHSGVPIYYENAGEIDLAAAGTNFLKCEVHFDSADQINIDPNPNHRTRGTLYLTAFARDSEGTVPTLGYLDELSTMFRFKTLSGVHLQAPIAGQEVHQGGWFSMQLKLHFWADSNS